MKLNYRALIENKEVSVELLTRNVANIDKRRPFFRVILAFDKSCYAFTCPRFVYSLSKYTLFGVLVDNMRGYAFCFPFVTSFSKNRGQTGIACTV